MSSFKKSSKSQNYYCSYCKKKYIPGQQPHGGYQCPICYLWQPSTPISLIKQNKKQIQNIYVINLKRDHIRWNLFLKRLQICHLQGRRIHKFIAVDGSNPYHVDVVLDHIFDEKDHRKEQAKQFKKQTPGSIGCCLSHLTLWQTLLANQNKNEPYALIMEDDAYFTPNAIQNIEIALEQANRFDWDILYVGHNHLRGYSLSPLFLQPRHAKKGEPIKGYNTGFFGYIVRLSSLPKLISIVKKMDQPYVDLQIRNYFGDIKALFLIPNLIQHNKIYTSSRRILDSKKP